MDGSHRSAQSVVHLDPQFQGNLAAIYARVSTKDQADRGYSLPTQHEQCLAFALDLGYVVEHVFQEDYSGVSLRRPQLTILRDLVRERRVKAVIVYDADRLSRKLAHQLLLIEELEQCGVELHVVTAPDRKNTPEGRLFAHMQGVIAEFEREKLLEKTRRGREGRAKAGHAVYGRVTYGYCYIKDKPKSSHYEIHEPEAAVVRTIFMLYVEQGLSQEAIARKLIQDGIKSPKAQYRRLPLYVWH
jgi:site-specific DNA recombinase